MASPALVHIVTLGCARNETDSEQLAGQLLADGLELTDDPGRADVLLVNTCGFIDAAKKDSIDTLLGLADVRALHRGARLVATGCMAQRYGAELAATMPELDGVLGFADYATIGTKLRQIMDGQTPAPPVPQDARIVAAAPAAPDDGPTSPLQTPRRARLDDGPYAPLKIASGCDRRCAFCAIPSFRGSYRSRPADDIVAEARWLVDHGVREIMLVSENSSSYGKDIGNRHALPSLLGRLADVDGLAWVRVSYLQPAEITQDLLDAMAATPNVVPYFDLSFQHASGPLLRRMRRFGDASSFLDLLSQVRDRCPQAGVRTSVIVGFPGETDDDIAVLRDFLGASRADAIGVFAYSDEEGTEAYNLDGHVPDDVIAARAEEIGDLATWLIETRASERVGELVQVLVESVDDEVCGRAAHQGPEVDGTTTLNWPGDAALPSVGDLVWARVTSTDGVDLIAKPTALTA